MGSYASKTGVVTGAGSGIGRRVILRGVARKRARVPGGPDAKAMDSIVHLTGSRYQPVITALSA